VGTLVLVLVSLAVGQTGPTPFVTPAGPLEPINPPDSDKAPTAKKPPPREPLSDLGSTPAVLPPPDQVLPIDLCTALKLAEAENPTIGVSRQAIQEALAQQCRADVLLLPSLRAGTNYHSHNGVLQTSFGEIRHVDSSALYAGGGARALAAETVAFPMVQIFSPLANAFLEPLVARRQVAVRTSQLNATANQVLLVVADRFLELVNAEASLVSLRQSEVDMGEIVELTAAFERAGRGRQADAKRSRAEALLLRTEVQRAEEDVAVASANLAEVLNLDTAVRLRTPAQATGLLRLVEQTGDPEALVRQGQAFRPEMEAASAEIARREARVTQEKVRPFLPTVSLGFSTGVFGGGTSRTDLVLNRPSFGRFSGRSDLDLVAWWTLQNLGVGNHALQKERRAEREEAILERVRVLNLVRREVLAASSRTEAALRRVEIAQRQLQTAEEGHRLDLRRIRGGQGLPIEVLNSMNRLIRARLNQIQALLEYNRSQFELFVALGGRPTNACISH
jgi:outer membrane protein TolC